MSRRLALGLLLGLAALPVHAAARAPHPPLDVNERGALPAARHELRAALKGRGLAAPLSPSPAPTPAKLTTIDIDVLAPKSKLRTLGAKLPLAKVAPTPAQQGWDLARMSEGGFHLPHGRLRLVQRNTGLSWEHISSSRLELAFDGDGMPSLLYEASGGVAQRADRARLAWFGIRGQADLDLAVLQAMLNRARSLYASSVITSAGSALKVPWRLPEETELVEVKRLTPAQRATVRAQVLARVEEERQLQLAADGRLHTDDLELLVRLRDLAPVEEVAGNSLHVRPTQQKLLVLATHGGRTLTVGRKQGTAPRPVLLVAKGPSSRDARQATVEDLRSFGIGTPAELEAVLGRAILTYAPEDFSD